MPYAFYMDVPIDQHIYAKIREKLDIAPPRGLIMHLVVKREGGLRYIDVWESKEVFEETFEAQIHPKVHQTFEEIGYQPDRHVEAEPLEILHLWSPLAPT